MAFQQSPGTNVTEIDLTTIVPAVGTTEAAFAGDFAWGPVDQIITISNEIQLVDRFGKPNSTNFVSFFSAANFLGYGRNLKLIRAATANMKNATSGSETILIKNKDQYEVEYLDLSASASVGMFAARYPGELGNSITVEYAANTAGFTSWSSKEEFDSAPGTSPAASKMGGVGDELHILVRDTGGKFTGTPGTILEKFGYVSKGSDAKNDDGSSNYYVNVINERSKYVYVTNHPVDQAGSANVGSVAVVSGGTQYSNGTISFTGGSGTGATATVVVANTTGIILSVNVTNGGTGYIPGEVVTANLANVTTANSANAVLTVALNTLIPSSFVNWGSSVATNFTANNGAVAAATYPLSGGVAASPTGAELNIAYGKFRNSEDVDISLIITGGAPQITSEYVIEEVAEFRKDCVAFVSPAFNDTVNNAGSEVEDIKVTRDQYNSSSYAFMDSGWKYQFDKYNNVYRWVPLNADMAGLCVRTDFDRDPWFSPAGFNRGSIKNVVKLSWNPNKTDRDELYKAGINPVVTFPGQGVILYGDKTLLDRPSAFDRINVRRLFIVLEKAIARASKYSLFEFNDEFTRAQFVALVEPFLRDVKGRRGIYDYRVVCNESNNTPEVIDRNEFVGDIYIKPARSINFIQLNFVAVRTGVAFEEIVGRF